ncbi:MAG TPA: succinate dehydrogenase assembly factor 2 [Gammaproteobacteria bacterium]|jgi:antitoxin CptB|nr:succinate dehydrogenase assembly factor 2 [Gammaproteobacteria bacterium]
MNDRNRHQWRCRRGIRELDLLLRRFLEQGYDRLSHEEKRMFEHLLDQSDPDLLAWLMGNSDPLEENARRLVADIRATVLNG